MKKQNKIYTELQSYVHVLRRRQTCPLLHEASKSSSSSSRLRFRVLSSGGCWTVLLVVIRMFFPGPTCVGALMSKLCTPGVTLPAAMKTYLCFMNILMLIITEVKEHENNRFVKFEAKSFSCRAEKVLCNSGPIL